MPVKVKKKTELELLEELFAKLAQKIYEKSESRIKPTWPWVLIRLVPKEQRHGSLYLPDNAGAAAQNKPLWEGIVLETWEPHWSRVRQLRDGTSFKAGERSEEVWRQSDFKRGDRILFPHYAGLPPHEKLDSNKYRLVREWTFDTGGGALGILHYDCDKKYLDELDRLFVGLESKTLSGK